MEVRAKLNYLRIAPRKVRLAADIIRRKRVEEAQAALRFTIKKSAKPLLKLINSAVANAKNNFGIDPENLYIAKINVDEGPKYKRWQPRARGQSYQVQKKTSHITLVLKETAGPPKKARPKKARAVKDFEKKEISRKTTEKEQAASVEALPAKEKEKPKYRRRISFPKPRIDRVFKRIFRRKSF